MDWDLMSQLEHLLHLVSQQDLAVYGIVVLFGLMIGSFVNVVVFRLPKTMLDEPQIGKWPILGVRSKCPSCEYIIRWYENVPVFSFLWLKGQCVNCQTTISLRYPLIEMLVAAFAFLVFSYFGSTWEAMAYFAFCCILLALSLIDFDRFLLPDALTLPAIWIGLFINAFELLIPAREAILGAACGWVVLAAINTVYKFISNRDGIGRGDWKLTAAIGAWLGLNGLLTAVLIAFLLGAIVGIFLLIVSFRNHRAPVPFGPFLAIGGIIATFHGPDISNLYLDWLI